MKTCSLGLLLAILVWFPAQAQTDSVSTAERQIFTVVEQPPRFPGGMSRLGNYFRKNMRYPEVARNAGLEGKVFVTFIITDQGRIEEVRPLKRLGMGLDEEAVRLIQDMPNWIPGKQAGRAVTVRYNLPVNFSL